MKVDCRDDLTKFFSDLAAWPREPDRFGVFFEAWAALESSTEALGRLNEAVENVLDDDREPVDGLAASVTEVFDVAMFLDSAKFLRIEWFLMKFVSPGRTSRP